MIEFYLLKEKSMYLELFHSHEKYAHVVYECLC